MQQILIVAAAAVIALAVGWFMQRRRPDAPSVPAAHRLPEQLDRTDFDRPEAPWLVAVFTSDTCSTCAKVWQASELLAADDVAVQNVEVDRHGALHERYGITAVPGVVIADADGVTRAEFLGPPSAADLWATMAQLRT